MKDIVVVASYNEVDNFPKVERYIKKNNLTSKVIYGVKVLMLINEIKVPVIILVRNQVGLKNLYKIISLIKTKNKKQFISKEEMVSYSEGLLYGLNVLDMDFVYKEISDEDIMNDMMWYDFIFIDEKKNLLNKQEYLKKMILLARKRRKIVFNFNTDEEFRDDRDKIVSLIESVKINKDNVYFPKIKNSKDVFIKEIEEGLHRLYGKEIPLVVLKRINEELYGKNKKGGIINSENESIYLIYKELVLKSKQLGYIFSTIVS